ncbi:hypothetical protein ACFX2I_044068 [Malus domestica]
MCRLQLPPQLPSQGVRGRVNSSPPGCRWGPPPPPSASILLSLLSPTAAAFWLPDHLAARKAYTSLACGIHRRPRRVS